jgi:hypothetical protein
VSDFPAGRGMIYMTELSEPGPNKLRVLISEAKPKEIARDFELSWENYVAYSVRNESFAQFDKDRPSSDSQLTERVSSAYLRFVAETTFAAGMVGSVLKGPLRHWELTCGDHFLDVVSSTPPAIRLINSN